MGWFNKVSSGVMNVGAAAVTVGGGAIETAGHATAHGFHTVVGNEDAARREKERMERAAQNVGEGVAAMSNKSEPWCDLDNSHQPQPWMADWMAATADSRLICDLYLVGTHDTVAKQGGDFAQCQSWDITKQLHMGLRYFDVRCKWDGDELRGYHGIIDMEITLRDVAISIEAFLNDHPTEVVIVAISTKGCSKTGTHSHNFIQTVRNMTDQRPGCNPARWCFFGGTWPALGTVRGKCFQIIGNGWPGNTQVQDKYDTGNYDEKLSKVWTHARQRKPKGHMSLNYTSCVGSEGTQLHTPKQLAIHINEEVHKEWERIWHRDAPDVRPGAYLMDFPGVDTITMILTHNSPKVFALAIDHEKKNDIVETFKQWDTNGDGTITKDELVRIFSSLDPDVTNEAVQGMLDGADCNSDGQVSYAEFVKWLLGDDEAAALEGAAKDLDFFAMQDDSEGLASRAQWLKTGVPMTPESSEQWAQEQGGRLLELEEARSVMDAMGALFPGEDQWTCVQGPNGPDWVQTGDAGHPPGKSHGEDFGPPGWGNDANPSSPVAYAHNSVLFISEASHAQWVKPGGPMTFASSEQYAAQQGGRLLRLEEARILMDAKGALFPDDDQWAAVQGPDGPDWVQVGDASHPPGKSHVENHGPPGWGNDANPGSPLAPYHNSVIFTPV